MHIFFCVLIYLRATRLCEGANFMQSFVNSVEKLNSPVYSAPPCTIHINTHWLTVKCSCSLFATVPLNQYILMVIKIIIIFNNDDDNNTISAQTLHTSPGCAKRFSFVDSSITLYSPDAVDILRNLQQFLAFRAFQATVKDLRNRINNNNHTTIHDQPTTAFS